MKAADLKPQYANYFDTLRIPLTPENQKKAREAAQEKQINLRYYEDGSIGVSLDERTREEDLQDIVSIFAQAVGHSIQLPSETSETIPERLRRQSPFLTHPTFHKYRSEHQLTRFLHKLVSKDISLVHSMIPLGSCTMKLNPVAALMPISWSELNDLHPFIPPEQAAGYQEMLRRLEAYLCEITGFSAVSFQPNSGA